MCATTFIKEFYDDNHDNGDEVVVVVAVVAAAVVEGGEGGGGEVVVVGEVEEKNRIYTEMRYKTKQNHKSATPSVDE